MEKQVINPLKGKTKYGWHFEQNVYDPQGIIRAIKSGGVVEISLKQFTERRMQKWQMQTITE